MFVKYEFFSCFNSSLVPWTLSAWYNIVLTSSKLAVPVLGLLHDVMLMKHAKTRTDSGNDNNHSCSKKVFIQKKTPTHKWIYTDIQTRNQTLEDHTEEWVGQEADGDRGKFPFYLSQDLKQVKRREGISGLHFSLDVLLSWADQGSCSPCAPNLLHVLVSRILGYHNLCSPGWFTNIRVNLTSDWK